MVLEPPARSVAMTNTSAPSRSSSPAAHAAAHPADASPWGAFLLALRSIPDPRTPRGTRHPLDALLAMLLLGFCCGQRSVQDVLDFFRPREALRACLGFTRPDMPSAATYSRLLAALPADALARALGPWLGSLALARHQRRRRGGARPGPLRLAAVDGKSVGTTGEHMLGLFLADVGVALDMVPVDARRNEASTLLERLAPLLEKHPWLEALSFDAAYANRSLAAALGRAGLSGLFQIKRNQPETLRRLERFFHPLPKDRPDFETVEKGGPGSRGGASGRAPRRRTSSSCGPRHGRRPRS